MLAFGGMAVKNADVASGGVSRHIERDAMQRAAARGTCFYCISPLRDDLSDQANASWLPREVGTDVALMLALTHTLVVEELCDKEFVSRYTTGFASFERYLLGREDGVVKDASWAEAITGIASATMIGLARKLPRGRTLMPGVLQLSTGAWYDPRPGGGDRPLCVHGNPNVLTRDIGRSRLAQGCCGQVSVVACEKYPGELPPIRAFDPPQPGRAARKDALAMSAAIGPFCLNVSTIAD